MYDKIRYISLTLTCVVDEDEPVDVSNQYITRKTMKLLTSCFQVRCAACWLTASAVVQWWWSAGFLPLWEWSWPPSLLASSTSISLPAWLQVRPPACYALPGLSQLLPLTKAVGSNEMFGHSFCCRLGFSAEFPTVADYAQPLLQREASSGQWVVGSREPRCPVLPLTTGPGPTVPVRLEGGLPHPGWPFAQLLCVWGSDEAPGGPKDKQG